MEERLFERMVMDLIHYREKCKIIEDKELSKDQVKVLVNAGICFEEIINSQVKDLQEVVSEPSFHNTKACSILSSRKLTESVIKTSIETGICMEQILQSQKMSPELVDLTISMFEKKITHVDVLPSLVRWLSPMTMTRLLDTIKKQERLLSELSSERIDRITSTLEKMAFSRAFQKEHVDSFLNIEIRGFPVHDAWVMLFKNQRIILTKEQIDWLMKSKINEISADALFVSHNIITHDDMRTFIKHQPTFVLSSLITRTSSLPPDIINDIIMSFEKHLIPYHAEKLIELHSLSDAQIMRLVKLENLRVTNFIIQHQKINDYVINAIFLHFLPSEERDWFHWRGLYQVLVHNVPLTEEQIDRITFHAIDKVDHETMSSLTSSKVNLLTKKSILMFLEEGYHGYLAKYLEKQPHHINKELVEKMLDTKSLDDELLSKPQVVAFITDEMIDKYLDLYVAGMRGGLIRYVSNLLPRHVEKIIKDAMAVSTSYYVPYEIETLFSEHVIHPEAFNLFANNLLFLRRYVKAYPMSLEDQKNFFKSETVENLSSHDFFAYLSLYFTNRAITEYLPGNVDLATRYIEKLSEGAIANMIFHVKLKEEDIDTITSLRNSYMFYNDFKNSFLNTVTDRQEDRMIKRYFEDNGVGIDDTFYDKYVKNQKETWFSVDAGLLEDSVNALESAINQSKDNEKLLENLVGKHDNVLLKPLLDKFPSKFKSRLLTLAEPRGYDLRLQDTEYLYTIDKQGRERKRAIGKYLAALANKGDEEALALLEEYRKMRQDMTGKEIKATIVISDDPVDMMGKTTGKDWTSCESVGGTYGMPDAWLGEEFLDEQGREQGCGWCDDIAYNNLIAYFIPEGEERWGGRVVLRGCKDTETGKSGVGFSQFYSPGRLEPIRRPFLGYLEKILKDKGYLSYKRCATPYVYSGFIGYSSSGISGTVSYHHVPIDRELPTHLIEEFVDQITEDEASELNTEISDLEGTVQDLELKIEELQELEETEEVLEQLANLSSEIEMLEDELSDKRSELDDIYNDPEGRIWQQATERAEEDYPSTAMKQIFMID